MSNKAWTIFFFATCLSLVGAVFGFNYYTDPYGAFGDTFLEWHGYGMTKNPRVAKTAYLEEYGDQYDAFIVGPSSTSSYPTEALNKLYDANFYNYIVYSADMWDSEQMIYHLLEEYSPKQLILNVYISHGYQYHLEQDPLSYSLHHLTNPELSALEYYWRYLTLHPKLGLEKLELLETDQFLPQAFDVFIPETGTYNKYGRDAEHISNMEDYLLAYPNFSDYYVHAQPLVDTEACMESVARILERCEQEGVPIEIVTSPLYIMDAHSYPREDVEGFYTALAEVTDYWDFTLSSISHDPRFFYDNTHFRNNVGEMAVARMAGDESIYIPDDFGFYVTKETITEHFESIWNVQPAPEEETSHYVPILMYHNLLLETNGSDALTVEKFEYQMKTLSEQGFVTVTLDDMVNYVKYGGDLPEKSILITFDDGYASNYEYAYPILKKYNMKATFFVIGVSVGKDTYKDLDVPIFPHFSYEESQEMIDSGLISIQSHTYDMHQWAPLETEVARETVSQLEGESDWDYIAHLTQDYLLSKSGIEDNTTNEVSYLAYPLGESSPLSEYVLTSLGVEATMSTIQANNLLVRGMPQSLLALKRYHVGESTPIETVLYFVTEQ
ncbi:MAG: polysaccharide deacetylase family protein [Eubacteriales bacterium]